MLRFYGVRMQLFFLFSIGIQNSTPFSLFKSYRSFPLTKVGTTKLFFSASSANA